MAKEELAYVKYKEGVSLNKFAQVSINDIDHDFDAKAYNSKTKYFVKDGSGAIVKAQIFFFAEDEEKLDDKIKSFNDKDKRKSLAKKAVDTASDNDMKKDSKSSKGMQKEKILQKDKANGNDEVEPPMKKSKVLLEKVQSASQRPRLVLEKVDSNKDRLLENSNLPNPITRDVDEFAPVQGGSHLSNDSNNQILKNKTSSQLDPLTENDVNKTVEPTDNSTKTSSKKKKDKENFEMTCDDDKIQLKMQLKQVQKEKKKLELRNDCLQKRVEDLLTENRTYKDLNFQLQNKVIDKWDEQFVIQEQMKGSIDTNCNIGHTTNYAPIGYEYKNEGQTHIGRGTKILTSLYANILVKSRSPYGCVSNILRTMFKNDVLIESTVSGNASNRNLGNDGAGVPKALDPSTLLICKDFYEHWLEAEYKKKLTGRKLAAYDFPSELKKFEHYASKAISYFKQPAKPKKLKCTGKKGDEGDNVKETSGGDVSGNALKKCNDTEPDAPELRLSVQKNHVTEEESKEEDLDEDIASDDLETDEEKDPLADIPEFDPDKKVDEITPDEDEDIE